jgi:hypothetical protein
MATYFVSQLTGNDSNAGTSIDAPKLTINGAWSLTVTGDSIEIIDSETYTGTNNHTLSLRVIDDITVKASTGKTPIINGGDSAAYFIKFDENYTFSGLTFQNFVAGDNGILTHRTTSGITTLTVTECIFRNSTGQILDLDQVDTLTTIERCQFYNNASQQESGGGSAAVQVSSGTNRVNISNCLFYNLGPRNVGFNIIDSRNDNTSITHCTFAKRDASVVNPQIPTRLFRIGRGDFKFNILYEFEASAETIAAATGADIQYNVLGNDSSVSGSWSGSAGPFNGGTAANNQFVTSDPGFVSYTANDYRLTAVARSIAVDSASGSTETVDITNQNRLTLDKLAYDSGILDMGCYETSFWSAETPESLPQIGSDFTINRNLNAKTQWNRALDTATDSNHTVEQVPFSVAMNGPIPSIIRTNPNSGFSYKLETGTRGQSSGRSPNKMTGGTPEGGRRGRQETSRAGRQETSRTGRTGRE